MCWRLLSISLVAVCLACPQAAADRYELAGGGVLEGTLVGRGDQESYIVRSHEGVVVELPRDEVARIVEQGDAVGEYLRRSRRAADTVEAHRRLADWCREHDLPAEREHHLRQIVRLNPSDEAARKALGFQQRGSRWMNRAQIMAARGMSHYKGSYRTPQEIALLKRAEQREQSEADWHGQMKRLRSGLNHRRPERVAAAKAELSSVEDPNAAPALVHWLSEERDDWTRRLLLDILYRLEHPLRTQTLVQMSIYDADPEIRLLCVDLLTRDGGRVPLRPYVEALASKDNEIVNQAAAALGAIGDAEAVSPLIDALITRHKYTVGSENSGQINAAFGSGSGGFTAGGKGPKVIRRDHENLGVYRALTHLTAGADFGYDEVAWRHWFVNKQKVRFASSRRDQ